MLATLREIIAEHLKQGGYDGLMNRDEFCACKVDDLLPCEWSPAGCVPGHTVPCDGECEYGDGCTWHIAPGPRKKGDGA